MRLIDADKLILLFADWQLQESAIFDQAHTSEDEEKAKLVIETIESCINAIIERPTAYDVSKVETQLLLKMNNSFNQRYAAFGEALKVVRGGGLNGN